MKILISGCLVHSKNYLLSFFVICSFILFVNALAYIQLSFVLKIPVKIHFFIIPTILASLFGFIIIMIMRNSHFGKVLHYDHLTGARSRYASELLFETEMKRYKRDKQKFSIIFYDIDDFKHINDIHGHQIGDKILKSLSTNIKKELRDMDTLFRWGGEEFIVLLPNTGKQHSYALANNLREKVNGLDFGLKRPITISLGVTTISKNDTTIDNLIKRSDQAMYKAKRSGKNRVEFL